MLEKLPKFPRSHRPLFSKLPLWLLLVLLLLIFGYWKSTTDDTLLIIFLSVIKGLGITLFVAGVAFTCSIILGLILGALRSSKVYIVSQLAGTYIEIVRGLPIIVILYYIAFVISPQLVNLLNVVFKPLIAMGMIDEFTIRNFDFLWRGIIALVFAYSAFIAEIFRAGIESVDQGQIEAAESLSFTRTKMFFPIILPQAIRNVLPALANELVAIVKDSSLVSILGVADITQIGKVYSISTFKYAEAYNIVALLYLTLTITLSFFVKFIEKKFSRNKKNYENILK